MVHGTLHLLGYDHVTTTAPPTWRRAKCKALARLGIADPYVGDLLMATRHDDDGGSRPVARHARADLRRRREPTLRDQIEEAIDEADDTSRSPATSARSERQMLRNLLHFGDRTAGEICVTRGDIVSVPATISFEELEAAFAEAGHSRLPVYRRESRSKSSA